MRVVLLLLVALIAPARAEVLREPIGPIRHGMTDARVARAAGAPTAKGKPTYAGDATSDWEKTWTYPGARVTFYADREHGPTWRVRSIEVTRGSRWKTKRGIGVGAARAQVAKAYRRVEDKEWSTDEHFVAGSVYGGVTFTFVDGKVTSIFVGSAF